MASHFVKAGVPYTFVEMSDWFRSVFPSWEDATFRTFARVAEGRRDKVALDIGAWIGTTAVWLASNFAHVVCVEADVVSLRQLRANLDASGVANATIITHPIAQDHRHMFFGPNADQRHYQVLNDSTSQAKAVSTSPLDYAVATVTLADMPRLADVGFVKVDIEGGEEAILADLFAYFAPRRVPMLVSFHVPWWKDQNIARCAPLFERAVCRDEASFEVIPDACAYVASRGGFCAVLFEFE